MASYAVKNRKLVMLKKNAKTVLDTIDRFMSNDPAGTTCLSRHSLDALLKHSLDIERRYFGKEHFFVRKLIFRKILNCKSIVINFVVLIR